MSYTFWESEGGPVDLPSVAPPPCDLPRLPAPGPYGLMGSDAARYLRELDEWLAARFGSSAGESSFRDLTPVSSMPAQAGSHPFGWRSECKDFTFWLGADG